MTDAKMKEYEGLANGPLRVAFARMLPKDKDVARVLDEAADAIDALLAEVPRWIPVAERLPERGEWALAWVPPTSSHACPVHRVTYWPDEGWRGCEWIEVFPTHWMPLLSGPESAARAAAGGDNTTTNEGSKP